MKKLIIILLIIAGSAQAEKIERLIQKNKENESQKKRYN